MYFVYIVTNSASQILDTWLLWVMAKVQPTRCNIFSICLFQ